MADRMRRLTAALAAACAFSLASHAIAVADVVSRHVPNAQVVGEGRMTFLFWDMYDATLYAPDGKWDWDRPYALSLAYLREFTGKSIAKTSADEIERLGEVDGARLAAWQGRMEEIFPDVDATSRITGIRDADGNALFYRDGELIGTIEDPDFSRLFFAIWLDERTLATSLRARLLGMAAQ